MNIETIWSEYQSRLRGFLNKSVHNPDDVDELLQEILIKAYQHLPAVRDTTKIHSWLFQIAHHAIADFYRQKTLTGHTDITENALWQQEPPPAAMEQLAECVIPFIQELPEENANLLMAVDINGIPQKAYAREKGIHYSTLKSRVQKSRTMLYRQFDECCTFAIDNQGKVIDYQAKKKTCAKCKTKSL